MAWGIVALCFDGAGTGIHFQKFQRVALFDGAALVQEYKRKLVPLCDLKIPATGQKGAKRHGRGTAGSIREDIDLLHF